MQGRWDRRSAAYFPLPTAPVMALVVRRLSLRDAEPTIDSHQWNSGMIGEECGAQMAQPPTARPRVRQNQSARLTSTRLS